MGWAFYGIYDVNIRGPFVNYLEECGNLAQYTIAGTPEYNKVAKRRKCTLMDIGQMLSCTIKSP